MSVIWNNLSFKTDINNVQKLLSTVTYGCCCLNSESKEILRSVFGSINRGELVALLGPSGAGKSTLLNSLTQGRKWEGCEGAIYVEGLKEPVRASFINQNECEHLLLPLTVFQSLRYASQLKNPKGTSDKVHDEIVRGLIKDLDLKVCEHTSVSQCSGGQKKRLAIGLELTSIKKPHFLYLDEPISGLDSYVGYKVVKLLSGLAGMHNMGIVVTIHQPSYKLFSQFSKAFILSGAGDFLFAGQPSKLREYLERSGYAFDEDCNENPADVAIELASAAKRRQPKQTARNFNDAKLFFINLAEDDDNDSTTSQISLQVDSFETFGDDSSQVKICSKMVDTVQESYKDFLLKNLLMQSSSIIRQEDGLCRNEQSFNLYSLWILLQRCAHTSIIKQKQFILIRLALHCIVAVVLAALYSRDIGRSDSCRRFLYPDPFNCSCTPETLRGSSQDQSGKNVNFQFFSMLFLMFASLMPTVLTFPSEIKLFLNEYRNGWYSTLTYYIAKTITEIPFQLLFPSLYVYFLYWYSQQIGMDHWYGGIVGFMSSRYFDFYWVTILCCFIAQGIGFLIGILCVRSFNNSIIVSSSVLLFLFLFSGFFVKRVQMGESVEWITHFSFVRFGLESLLLVIYGKGRCVNPEKSSILTLFSLKDNEFPFNVWMLIVHLVVIRVVAFFVLKYMVNPNFLKLDAKWLNYYHERVQSNTRWPIYIKKFAKRSTISFVWICLLFLGLQFIVGVGIGITYLIKGIAK